MPDVTGRPGPNAQGWRIFVVVLMLALTVPRLWQRGMFLDGMTYAVVARNMAQGVGTLWAPSFSGTSYQQFFEQPPLGLALQAMAFATFGDSFAVERVFSLAMFFLTGLLIAAIWRRFLGADYDWLPVLIWLVPSVVTWAVINNMLESTQAVFTTFACYALIRTASASTRAASGAWAAAAAVAVAGGVLAKGPVGFFPLALPLPFLILSPSHRPRHPVVVWTTAGAVVTAIAAGLAWYGPSRRALQAFASSHLAPALAGERGIGPLGADIARHLTMGIALRMAIVVLLFWAFRRFRATLTTTREAAFFLAIACAASVPILMSPVLAGHYFYPSTPFFALAFGALALPAASAGARQVGRRRLIPYGLSGGLAALVVIVLVTNGPLELRSTELIRSLDAIRDVAPVGQTIGACPSSKDEWGLKGYLQRFYRISLDTDGAAPTDWFLATPGACTVGQAYEVVRDTESFTLLRSRR